MAKKTKIKKKIIPKENRDYKISIFLGFCILIIGGVLVFNFLNRGNNKNSDNNLKSKIEVTKEIFILPSVIPTPKLILPTLTEKSDKLPIIYTVLFGDDLWDIAVRFYDDGYKWVNISETNKLENPDIIYTDSILTIPKLSEEKGDIGEAGISTYKPPVNVSNYTIKQGEYLWEIAVKTCGDGYQWVKIAKDNNLTNPDLIHSDNKLKINCQ